MRVIDEKTGEIITAGCEFTKTSLTLDPGINFDKWEIIGKQLNQIEGAIQWWVGDWLNFGERKYGEMYAQAIDESQVSTWQNYKYTSKAVESSRRRELLPWSHHREVAALPPDEQKYWLEKAEQEGLSKSVLRQAIKHAKLLLNPQALPDGKYSVIYADPPWKYENSGFEESAEDQYPTMELQDIADLNVASLCTDETVLFLWATNPLLQEALFVVDSWGFEYKTNMAWVKDLGRGKGWYLKSKHELLIIATKPNTPHPLNRPDSCFEANRGKVHSRKPELVYNIIDSMYPGKKIELFAREIRPGWETWGNQA